MGFVTDAPNTNGGSEAVQFITNYDMLFDGGAGGEKFYLPKWEVGGNKIFFQTIKPNADPADEDVFLLWGYTGGSSISVYGERNGASIRAGMTSSPNTGNSNYRLGSSSSGMFPSSYVYTMDLFFLAGNSHAAAKYDIIIISKNGVLNAWATQTMMHDM